jgi:hypothetical protein
MPRRADTILTDTATVPGCEKTMGDGRRPSFNLVMAFGSNQPLLNLGHNRQRSILCE